MKQLLPTVVLGLGVLCIIGCDKKETQTTQTDQNSSNSSSAKQYHQYTASDIVEMNEVDLLLAIKECGFENKRVLTFTKRLKDIVPDKNKELGNALKQDYTFDWYATTMVHLKLSEQMFRALEMLEEADQVSKAVDSLEVAWAESDLHTILKLSFYNEDVDADLTAIEESMSEEKQQEIIIDTVPVKALAAKLLEQSEPNK